MTRDDVQSKLDVLFDSVQTYRSSEYFKNLMEFCAKFKNLAPYNAMLVRFQMPGARYVLTAREWERRYDRGIKPDAQPLTILMPFGPVDFVFEIQHTFPLGRSSSPRSNEDILKEVEKAFQTKGKLHIQTYKNLTNSLEYHGIAFNPYMNAGVGMAGKLQSLDKPSNPIKIYIGEKYSVDCPACYLISTNSQWTDEQRFATILHELGHFFCHHLPAPAHWDKRWPQRCLGENAEEFEAESVAWLICERLNIQNSSQRYLSGYLDEYEMIPDGVSIEYIFKAFNKIWEMCSSSNYSYKDGLLFKNDKLFQKAVKDLTSKSNK